MAYIGNTVENQGFTPAIDYFNGDGVTVTFTLSRPIASVAQVIVAIDNVIQNPSSSFTVAGNAITFSSAPLSGTNNIWVEYTSLITTYQAISQDPTVIGDIRATGGYLAEGDFGNSFVDGVIVDYVTGLGRVTVGTAEGIALYNGGTASRTERMRIDSSGNVGIGTASPTGKLDVSSSSAGVTAGDLVVDTANKTVYVGRQSSTGGDNSYLIVRGRVNGSGTNQAIAITGDTTAYGTGLFRPNNDMLGFSTLATERMRINSAGTLFIGGTSSPSGTQRLVLTANGSAGIEPMLFNELRSTSATENYVLFYRNGSQVGSITNTLSATAYVTSSDYRLKENIAPMTGALAKVAQLKPVTYTWKVDGSNGQGFIAHELQAVVPDCVTGEKDAVETYIDEEGNEQTRPKYQGIDTSFLVATLTAAIQELKAELDATKAEVQALKGVA